MDETRIIHDEWRLWHAVRFSDATAWNGWLQLRMEHTNGFPEVLEGKSAAALHDRRRAYGWSCPCQVNSLALATFIRREYIHGSSRSPSWNVICVNQSCPWVCFHRPNRPTQPIYQITDPTQPTYTPYIEQQLTCRKKISLLHIINVTS